MLSENLHKATAEDRGNEYERKAELYQEQGNYDAALDACQKAISIKEKLFGAEHAEMVSSYNRLGLIYENWHDYEKALENYQRALNISMKSYGEEHKWTATIYYNIAVLYQVQGNYDEALDACQKAISIKEKLFGAEHVEMVSSYNRLGLIYEDWHDYEMLMENYQQAKENYEKALEIYQRALSINIKSYGEEHEWTAIIYHNIAGFYRKRRYSSVASEAVDICQKAISIKEKVLGSEHPSIASTYWLMGLIYKDRYKAEKALEYLQKALRITIKSHGEEHELTASLYNVIATVYQRQGNYDEALSLLQRAQHINEKFFGAEHSAMEETYQNLAEYYKDMLEYDKALEFYDKVLCIQEKVYDNKEIMRLTGVTIKMLQENREYYHNLIDTCQKKLALEGKTFEVDRSDIAATYCAMAPLFQRWEDYEDAWQCYRSAKILREKALGPEHPEVIALGKASEKAYADEERALCQKARAMDLQPVFAYLQRLMDRYKSVIKPYKYDYCVELTRLFKEWYECGSFTAEELYDFIGMKEYGGGIGDGDEGIYEFSEIGDQDETEEISSMWCLVLSIFRCIVYIAMKREDWTSLPEDMDAICQKEIQGFFNLLERDDKTPEELFQYFCHTVCS